MTLQMSLSAVDHRLLSLKEAEQYSGISIWTLRDLIATGDLPAVRPPGLRRVWVDRKDLDRAIERWKERAG
jgi:excisionase family DNA binding protein